MKVVVRTARKEDAATLAGLYAELGYPSSVEAVRTRLADVLSDETHQLLVAVNATGDVIGSVHIGTLKLLEPDETAQVLGLVVAASARRHGAGRALMTAAEDWARSCGCNKVILRSSVRRTDAHAFYERIGYTNAKTQYAFRKLI